MDTQLAERTEAAQTGAARETLSEHVTGSRQAGVASLTTQHEWRWVPDAEETDLPATPVEKGSGPWGDLIRALAWASARFCG